MREASNMPATLPAEEFDANSDLCQGTTLVVPKMRQNNRWALQVAEKLIERVSTSRFVSGHDFSRAESAAKSTWPLGPEGTFPARNTKAPCPIHSPFFWRMGGIPRISTGICSSTALLALTPLGAPSLRRSCFCRKGGIAQNYEVRSIAGPFRSAEAEPRTRIVR